MVVPTSISTVQEPQCVRGICDCRSECGVKVVVRRLARGRTSLIGDGLRLKVLARLSGSEKL
jgi:hypothetical protein